MSLVTSNFAFLSSKIRLLSKTTAKKENLKIGYNSKGEKKDWLTSKWEQWDFDGNKVQLYISLYLASQIP